MGFLGNLVKVFPGLAKRPLYITGESYAGTYIVREHVRRRRPVFTCLQPYILKTYFEMTNPPVKISKIAIGDGTIPDSVVFELVPSVCRQSILFIFHSPLRQVNRDRNVPPAHRLRSRRVQLLQRTVRSRKSFSSPQER